MKKGFGVFFLSLFVMSALAAIEWEQTEQRVAVHPVQVRAVYHFSFRNTGNEPVDILQIRPLCGCLGARPDKRSYAPGERGELEVTFDLTDRLGSQSKSVAVVTSASKHEQLLSVETDIPRGYVVEPKRLIWEAGEELAAKTVLLKNASTEAVLVGDILVTDSRMKAELLEVRRGFEYQIKLTPEKGLSRFRCAVRIKTVPPEGLEDSKSYKMYVQIK